MRKLEYYSVDEYVYKLYEASPIAKNVSSEANRILKAEDFSWISRNVQPLTDIVLDCIASNFELFIDYFQSDEITPNIKTKLMHIIPTNLPLALSSIIIPEGVFWKRSCFDTWPMGSFMMQFNGSWKNLYMEKFLQTYLENIYPNNVNLTELKNLLEITNSFIFSLNIEQLLISDIEDDQDDEVQHIDLNFIISSLPHLQHYSLTCGVKKCSVEYSRNMYELSVNDCSNIGKGLNSVECLQSFKMHRCPLNVTRLRCILTHWEALSCLKTVEFMSCGLTDGCMSILVEALVKLSSLEELSLVNNNIGSDGAIILASSLDNCKSLKMLNLRLNFILDEGGIAIFTSVLKHNSIELLILEGCELGTGTIDSLCQLIIGNNHILEIDLSVNHLNVKENHAIVEAVCENCTLQRLDLRMNNVTSTQTKIISEKLLWVKKINKKNLIPTDSIMLRKVFLS